MTGMLETTGGSTAIVIAAIVGRFLMGVLALAIAYRAYTGYRSARSRPLLYLAAGLVFLAVVPTIVSFVLPTATDVSALDRTVVTTASELLGLLVILYAIYGTN
ncbi:DUF7521 family protein [Halorientalis salina]|jgi:hypothetical protein|uniref:DUF7521 family protein n=1 Tax=Halorientalis salina TaxID=2932266 RepID=UPI0010AC557A|nr:hypothetical protein [Halorientalis salina]